MVFNMRSNDAFLGNPFNIASYGVLLHIVADMVGRKPKELVFQGTNVHLYANHIEAVEELLTQADNTVDSYPELVIKNTHDSIFDFELDDFSIVNYHPNNYIFAPLNT